MTASFITEFLTILPTLQACHISRHRNSLQRGKHGSSTALSVDRMNPYDSYSDTRTFSHSHVRHNSNAADVRRTPRDGSSIKASTPAARPCQSPASTRIAVLPFSYMAGMPPALLDTTANPAADASI